MIVVGGEALIDLVDEGGGRYRAVPGGSPANVALGLARLGSDVQALTRLSRDAFGRQIAAHLEAAGVGLGLAVDADEPTPLAVASIAATGSATYSFYVEGTADRMWRAEEMPPRLPAGSEAFFLGSFALILEPGASLLTGLLERERNAGGATCFIDPNVRPALMGDPAAARLRTERLVAMTDVVKVSDEDLSWLAPDESPHDAARRWLGLGPRLVVVTQGAMGAFAIGHGIDVAVPSLPVRVVDTVGAGDSFSSALVDGLRRAGVLGPAGRDRYHRLDADTVEAVLRRAAKVSALTCARRGADPPFAAEVDGP